DNNHITIEGSTDLAFSDDVAKRFEGYHWHVQDLGDNANDLQTISNAFAKAKEVTDKPSLILLRSHIGFGAPHKQDTSEAHGSPLGEDEIRLTKKFYGWPEDAKFLVPDDVKQYMNKAIERGDQWEREWNTMLADYKTEYPELAAQFENYLKQ